MEAGGGEEGRRGRMGTAQEGALAYEKEGPLALYVLEQEAAACCALYWPGATRGNDSKWAGGQCRGYLIDNFKQCVNLYQPGTMAGDKTKRKT